MHVHSRQMDAFVPKRLNFERQDATADNKGTLGRISGKAKEKCAYVAKDVE
jgi:hypothetical protein